MTDLPNRDDQPASDNEGTHHDTDLSDLLEELRVLLPGTTTLTAFLIILPFNAGFDAIRYDQKFVYVLTFLCSLLALVLFTTPAAHHRLQRPLRDRRAFKNMATKLMIAGLIPLSVALVLAAQLVLSVVIGEPLVTWGIAGVLALIVLVLWWLYPLGNRDGTGTSA